MKLADNNGPIEVWLTQQNMAIACNVVFEDESADHLDVNSLSMRGAQREMTAWLIQLGYTPANRWQTEHDGETSRQFKPPH
jgi:hypothetical protein